MYSKLSPVEFTGDELKGIFCITGRWGIFCMSQLLCCQLPIQLQCPTFLSPNKFPDLEFVIPLGAAPSPRSLERPHADERGLSPLDYLL